MQVTGPEEPNVAHRLHSLLWSVIALHSTMRLVLKTKSSLVIPKYPLSNQNKPPPPQKKKKTQDNEVKDQAATWIHRKDLAQWLTKLLAKSHTNNPLELSASYAQDLKNHITSASQVLPENSITKIRFPSNTQYSFSISD